MAVIIAVAIVGVRQAVVGLGTRVLEFAAGIASLWILGLLFYLVPIILAVIAFGLLVGGLVWFLTPSRH